MNAINKNWDLDDVYISGVTGEFLHFRFDVEDDEMVKTELVSFESLIADVRVEIEKERIEDVDYVFLCKVDKIGSNQVLQYSTELIVVEEGTPENRIGNAVAVLLDVRESNGPKRKTKTKRTQNKVTEAFAPGNK